jgi:pimeloyl-ACP methyl ester carboxylesterase
VHGLHGSAGQLSRFITPLTRAGYRAVAFDAPAHGASEGQSTDVLEVEQAMLGVGDAFGELYGVIAFSLGCTWSLWSLSRGLAVERVVCIAPVARQSFLYETFVRRYQLSAAVAREFEVLHHERYGPFEDYDTIRLCRSLGVPALIYHDREDGMIPPGEGGARLSEAWSGSRFVATRGLGHFRIIRDAGVIDGVVRFLRSPS